MVTIGCLWRPADSSVDPPSGREMGVGPLNPFNLGEMLGLGAVLVTGGLPLICADWQAGQDLWDFLEQVLANPTSPLLVSGERRRDRHRGG
jgi:hypothetical protein